MFRNHWCRHILPFWMAYADVRWAPPDCAAAAAAAARCGVRARVVCLCVYEWARGVFQGARRPDNFHQDCHEYYIVPHTHIAPPLSLSLSNTSTQTHTHTHIDETSLRCHNKPFIVAKWITDNRNSACMPFNACKQVIKIRTQQYNNKKNKQVNCGCL